MEENPCFIQEKKLVAKPLSTTTIQNPPNANRTCKLNRTTIKKENPVWKNHGPVWQSQHNQCQTREQPNWLYQEWLLQAQPNQCKPQKRSKTQDQWGKNNKTNVKPTFPAWKIVPSTIPLKIIFFKKNIKCKTVKHYRASQEKRTQQNRTSLFNHLKKCKKKKKTRKL